MPTLADIAALFGQNPDTATVNYTPHGIGMRGQTVAQPWAPALNMLPAAEPVDPLRGRIPDLDLTFEEHQRQKYGDDPPPTMTIPDAPYQGPVLQGPMEQPQGGGAQFEQPMFMGGPGGGRGGMLGGLAADLAQLGLAADTPGITPEQQRARDQRDAATRRAAEARAQPGFGDRAAEARATRDAQAADRQELVHQGAYREGQARDARLAGIPDAPAFGFGEAATDAYRARRVLEPFAQPGGPALPPAAAALAGIPELGAQLANIEAMTATEQARLAVQMLEQQRLDRLANLQEEVARDQMRHDEPGEQIADVAAAARAATDAAVENPDAAEQLGVGEEALADAEAKAGKLTPRVQRVLYAFYQNGGYQDALPLIPGYYGGADEFVEQASRHFGWPKSLTRQWYEERFPSDPNFNIGGGGTLDLMMQGFNPANWLRYVGWMADPQAGR
jgi:hypothetical protein